MLIKDKNARGIERGARKHCGRKEGRSTARYMALVSRHTFYQSRFTSSNISEFVPIRLSE